MANSKNGVFVITDTDGTHTKKIIDDVCKMSGETFGHDPYCRRMLTDPVDVKVRYYLTSKKTALK